MNNYEQEHWTIEGAYDTHRPIKRPGLLFIAIVALFFLGVAAI